MRFPAKTLDRMQQVFRESPLDCKQIGLRIGRERKCVYMIRDCFSMPDWYSLSELCKTFNVSADWLLGLTDEKDLDCIRNKRTKLRESD